MNIILLLLNVVVLFIEVGLVLVFSTILSFIVWMLYFYFFKYDGIYKAKTITAILSFASVIVVYIGGAVYLMNKIYVQIGDIIEIAKIIG